MTDSGNTTIAHSGNARLTPQPWLALLLGPILMAQRGAWLDFWLFALADGWAVSTIAQGNASVGLIILILSRAGAAARASGLLGYANRVIVDKTTTGHLVPAWLIASSVYVASLVLLFLHHVDGAEIGYLEQFPASRDLHNTVARNIDAFIHFLTVAFDPTFRVVTRTLLGLLSALEATLNHVPWPVFFLVMGLMAWKRGGLKVLLLVWAALGYLGLFGFWDKAIITSSLVLAALVVCILFGLPIGVAAAKSRRVRAVVEPLLDFMQTMPSFVYLLPAVAFFSLGKPPALMATVVFAIPPLIRLTCLGIQQVPTSVKEAMHAHGATPFQTLMKAEMPLALPSIRTGINQTIMMSLAMVVISALIGGGGLGYDVLFALQNVQHGKGILAGTAIVFCAMIFDRLIRASKGIDHTRTKH